MQIIRVQGNESGSSSYDAVPLFEGSAGRFRYSTTGRHAIVESSGWQSNPKTERLTENFEDMDCKNSGQQRRTFHV